MYSPSYNLTGNVYIVGLVRVFRARIAHERERGLFRVGGVGVISQEAFMIWGIRYMPQSYRSLLIRLPHSISNGQAATWPVLFILFQISKGQRRQLQPPFWK